MPLSRKAPRMKSPKKRTPRMKLIQRGARTHHQDHSMTCVNFRTMKTMVRRPAKPMPLDWARADTRGESVMRIV